MQRLEIDGLIVRRALLPAPIEEADPFACQCPDRGLMGLALVALLLVVDLRPEGMPDRLRRPFDERLPEELGTLEAPVHPGLLAAACGDGRDPRIFLPCGGGGIACPLCAEGDEQPRGEDGSRPWERLEQRLPKRNTDRITRSMEAKAYSIERLTEGKLQVGNPWFSRQARLARP